MRINIWSRHPGQRPAKRYETPTFTVITVVIIIVITAVGPSLVGSFGSNVLKFRKLNSHSRFIIAIFLIVIFYS